MSARHFAFWPEGVPRRLDVPALRIHDNLNATALRVPDATAIAYYGTRLSYRWLADRVDRLAGYLQHELRVARGDRVPLLMQNSPQFVIAYYAILRADAVVVPLNPMLKPEELGPIVSELDARIAICGLPQIEPVKALIGTGALEAAIVASYGDALEEGQLPEGVRLPADVSPGPRAPIEGPGLRDWGGSLALGAEPRLSIASAGDLAVIVYTSGSTGEPRGCMHTHRTVQANIHAYAHWAPMDETSIALGTLPFFHATGMQSVMNSAINAGACNVIMTRWDAVTALALTERERITHWRLITTMMVDVMARPEFTRERIKSVKRIGGGGAAMPEALAKRLEEETGLAYVEGYGLSETIAACHINPPARPKRQCLGIPFIGVTSLVVDPETLRELPQGEVGEILVAGLQVFKGYWRKPELSAAVLIEIDGKSFLRTGDLGFVDEDGYFFLVDRLKRMINAAGLKIWPSEIEAMLYAHPAVQQAAVVAIGDARRGETAKAVIVRKTGVAAEADDIKSWLAERIAAYKVPTHYAFVDALPVLASGKVDWRRVQEDEQRRAAQDKE